ncbi:ABC transporter substrate-binding protein [Paenibacillus harenae]|uniref:ABC transporter substrate-binding protein n=1 Tax=Paenibacillus harenae TaxID=306543 RepID=UPI00040A71CE|nr:ABC transporter substrate-binding protein [Paenibacillus harenae]
MRIRWIRALGGLLLAAALLAATACGSAETVNLNALSHEAEKATDEAETLELATMKSSLKSLFVDEALFAEFERQTGIRINLQILPSEQVTAVLQTKLAVGEPPDLILYNLKTAAYELNLEKNFEILDEEPWAPRVRNRAALSYNGHIYGFHVSQDTGLQGVVYNKKIFRDLGLEVPRDYHELLAVCEKIKAAGIEPFFMPFKDAWAAHFWISSAFADYAKKNDPTLWDDLNAGKRGFADIAAFVDITQQQYDLFRKGYTNRNVLGDSYDMAVDKFIGHEAAMMTMGDWFIANVVKEDPSMELGLFPVPYAKNADLAISPLGGQLFIPKKSKHIGVAKRFLEFLATQEQAQRLVNQGLYISNLTDISTPRLPLYKQEIVDGFMEPGRTVMSAETNFLVDTGDIWKYLQELFAGGLTANELWKKWDKRFAHLMRERQMPGF